MKKSTVIALMGGSVSDLARAIDTTPSAIYQWPEVLPRRLVDRVIAAFVRLGRDVPEVLLKADSELDETPEADKEPG